MPFDEDDEKPNTPKVGLKIDNKNSIIEKIPKKPTKEAFEKKAVEVSKQMDAHAERASELALHFKKALDDKTLIDNKSIFAVDSERDLITSLVQLSIDMNNDPYEQKEGMGSSGLIALLLRAIFIQRDRINALDYAIHKLQETKNPNDTAKK